MECDKVHALVDSLRVFAFPYKEADIPLNGIYFLFECGEYAHGANRIVRIGTHTGQDQLRSRLKQHFLTENKDRSIFRKNIGRCFLHSEQDPFLQQWELDLTSRKVRDKQLGLVDMGKQQAVERRVSEYIQGNFSFVVIRIDDKEERLELESKLISTVSLCEECKPSKSWLGRHSPKARIRESGLWQVSELYKQPLSADDLQRLESYVGK